MDGLQILVIVVMVLVCAFATPALFFFCYKLWQQREQSLFIVNRDPLAIVISTCFIAFVITLGFPLGMMHEVRLVTLRGVIVVTVMQAMSSYAIINLMAIKSWLLFYRQRYQFLIENKQWQKAINGNISEWYSNNKHKFGSYKWLNKYVLLPVVLLEALFDSTRAQIDEVTGSIVPMLIINGLDVLVPIGVLIYCCIRSRKFIDVYHIRTEIWTQCLLFVGAFVGYVLLVLILAALDLSESQLDLTRGILANTMAISTFWLYGLVQVYYPLWLVRKHAVHLSFGDSETGFMGADAQQAIAISDVITDEQFFSLFMQHLVKSFCAENLSFIVELIQIKHAFQVMRRKLSNASNGNNALSTTQSTLDVSQNAAAQLVLHTGHGGDEDGDGAAAATTDDAAADVDQEIQPAQPAQQQRGREDIPLNILGLPVFTQLAPENPTPHTVKSFLYSPPYGVEHRLAVQLPFNLPRSEALAESPQFVAQMRRLYEKYIMVGARYEVNIPFVQRDRLISEFSIGDGDGDGDGDGADQSPQNERINASDYYCLMDDAALFLFGLLRRIYRRFQTSQAYQQYIVSEEFLIRRKAGAAKVGGVAPKSGNRNKASSALAVESANHGT